MPIQSFRLNKDGFHLNNYGNIKLAANFILRIQMLWRSEGSYREFKYYNNISIEYASNSVSSVNFDNDNKNSAGFFLKHALNLHFFLW